MIDVFQHHLDIVTSILRQFVPDCEVRVFGSRFTHTAKKHSDLDIAIVENAKISSTLISEIAEAFQESDLPFRVDVLDWNALNEEFKKVITSAGYEVIQERNYASSIHY